MKGVNGMANTEQHSAAETGSAALTTQESLRAIVIDVLKARGMPGLQAAQAEAYGEEVVKRAAGKVPSWVGYLFLLFGVPSLGAFYATAQAIWGMPQEVAALKDDLARHVEAEARALAEIKALLTGPASRPQ